MTVMSITGVERHFSPDEFIVSKTNTKGLITYVNDVFLRVSGYGHDEIMGRPHNAIRHPWMPRCVFKLLWDRISSGHEIFAYVVNRAKNGDHYWVLAHVTPSFNQGGEIIGYHSNRRVAERATIDKIAPLYKALRDLEDRYPNPKEAIAASMQQLLSWVEKNGGDYDALVFTL